MMLMRFLPFDILRIVAAALVIAAHAGLPAIGTFSTGGAGVTIFLIMSGFLLAMSDKSQPWAQFFWKRAARIYPTYWTCLVLAMLIAWTLPQTATEAALMLTGACAFAGQWGCSIVNTSWFIGLIMALYALYPLLKKLIDRAPLVSLATLFAVSLFMQRRGVLWLHLPKDPVWWFPLCRVFEFGLGIAIAPWIRRLSFRPSPAWLTYLAEWSFPAFLLHVPLLRWHLPLSLYLLAVLTMSAVASSLVLYASNRRSQSRRIHADISSIARSSLSR